MSEFSTDPEFSDNDIVGKNPDVMKNYNVVYDWDEAVQFFQNDQVIAFDLETTGFSFISDKIALIQFYGQQTGTVLLLRTPGGHVPQKVWDFMEAGTRKFVGHNIANFDIPFAYHAGLDYHKVDWFDTILAEALIVGINRTSVKKNLAASVRRRLGMTIDKTIEHSNWAAETLSERQVEYAVQDVVHLPALMEVQIAKAFETEQHEALGLEMQLAPIVAAMRINGLPINEMTLEDFLAKQEVIREENLVPFARMFPGVNPRSPVAIKKAIIAKGIPCKSTNKMTMQQWLHHGNEHQHDIAKVILDYRTPDQLIKMYGGDWAEKNIETDGAVHSNIWTCMTDTTRFSSSHPNGQQYPGTMRRCFEAPAGWQIVSPDYSQLEVRLAADVANDEALIAAMSYEDTHAAIGAQVFGGRPENLSPELRKKAKAMVFTLLFGGQPKTLMNYARAQGATMTLMEATKAHSKFFEEFQGLKGMHEWAAGKASRRNYTFLTLPYGYRRILDRERNRAPVIINTLIQGRAAVGTKLALIEAHRQGLSNYLSMQLHDEIISVVPNSEAIEYQNEMMDIMVSQMETLVERGTPIKVDGQIGQTWGGE